MKVINHLVPVKVTTHEGPQMSVFINAKVLDSLKRSCRKVDMMMFK